MRRSKGFRLIILCILLLGSTFLRAGNLPSAAQLDHVWAETITDLQKIKKLDLLFQQLNVAGIDYSLLHRESALALAKKNQLGYWEGKMYHHIGLFHFFKPQPDYYLAKKNWKLAITTFSQKKEKWVVQIMDVFQSMFNLYLTTNDYDELLNEAYQFLPIFEATKDSFYIAKTYNVIAFALTSVEKYQAALPYVDNGLSYLDDYHISVIKCLMLEQKATCHNYLGDKVKTFEAIDSVIVLADQLSLGQQKKQFYTSYFRTRRGNLYLQVEDYLQAEKNIQAAFNIMGDSVTSGYLYLDLGILEMKKENYEAAINSFIKFRNFYPNDKGAHLYLADSYLGLNNYEKAYQLQKEYWVHRDSLNKRDTEYKLNRINTEFDSEKKDAQIIKQQAEIIQQKKIQKMGLSIFGLIAILMLVLIWSFYRNKNKNLLLQNLNATLEIKNTELDKWNQQNELLLKEIHHRVKNNLETVSSLLALQKNQTDDPNVLNAIQDSQNRVQSMGMVHQKLYQGENLAAIEMKDYFINLGEGVLDAFGLEDRVRIHCEMEEVELEVDTAISVGLIVNELLTNALKYAFPDQRKGEVLINMQQIDDEMLLKVADNGIGKNNFADQPKEGFGTQLVFLLARELDGQLEECTAEGTTISLRFKPRMINIT